MGLRSRFRLNRSVCTKCHGSNCSTFCHEEASVIQHEAKIFHLKTNLCHNFISDSYHMQWEQISTAILLVVVSMTTSGQNLRGLAKEVLLLLLYNFSSSFVSYLSYFFLFICSIFVSLSLVLSVILLILLFFLSFFLS
jgi:hypothetical protein